MFAFLERFLHLRRRPTPEAAQSAFRAHYRSFRGLLTANNNALELMAALEEMLRAGKPYGMAVIRGDLTALTVNVYKMVQNLIALADGRYAELDERFRRITGEIESILARQPEVRGSALVLRLDEIDRDSFDQVGAKMANLGELRNRLGLRVPEGFAITAAAARQFMEASHIQDEINRRLKTLDLDDLEALYTVSAAIQELIRATPLPEAIEGAVHEAYAELAAQAGEAPLVSMRSSALGEDGLHGSFAGQYRTRLGVAEAGLASAYKEIVASKYQSQAIVYRQQRGYRHQDVLMAVGCLEMVDAVASGVAYSSTADGGAEPRVVIHAARGLGTRIVEGDAAYDLAYVAHAPPHAITRQRLADPTGTACLSDPQARELATQALRIEAHFGAPQDIEWALDRDGRLVILQARPIADPHAVPVSEGPEEPPGEEASGQPQPLFSGGVTASGGVAAGPVHKVGCMLDTLQFPKGGVLVVETPFAEWAVLLNRAAAVVSDTGQSATHLATVARELGVPALFDLPGAYAGLDNGRVVTVDANRRRLFAERVEALLGTDAPHADLMEGSPVQSLLKDALSHITPLHLTSPDSPYFKASSCRSLHDITRFCHEKALAEMFNFGHRYGARDKSAKQLYVVGMPSQWWAIDLNDGFREGADLSTPFIRIEDVVSAPMLAIWRGMTAVPWQGPPPVSLRGLGAIIAQSAMNPRLEPAVRSNMAGRNYFLLSRNYCNLSVRLGYHFALAEASFSELLTESYVNFRFQGGAADERRRLRRVRLLGEMLREFDFRVDITGDCLTARIEKRPLAFLRERLVVLGYLIIHTRQVDMVMDEEVYISRYVDKIRADIASIRHNLEAETAAAEHADTPTHPAG